MRIRILSMFAAALLFGACETAPKDTADSDESGAVTRAAPVETVAAAPVTAGPAAGSEEEFVAEVGDRVFFAFDSSELSADARTTLERQAFWLRKYPTVLITIEGHCDERGTREYNLALGERRANAVRDYLLALGVDAGRVDTISYGKERPVAFGGQEDAWSQNRRGVTVVN